MKKTSIIDSSYKDELKKVFSYKRNFLILLFICVLQVQATELYPQTSKFTISFERITLAEFFDEIEKQSEYLFIYKDIDVDGVKINLNIKNATITELLDAALEKTGLSYTIDGRHFSIFRLDAEQKDLKNAASDPKIQNYPKYQNITKKNITGNVTDEQGNPIIGANIKENGTTNGTISDENGSFSLNIEDNALISVSYMGFVTQEISTAGKTFINVILREDTKILDEFVVVGYESKRRRDITGSIEIVNIDNLQKTVSSSALQALQGLASGVNIVSSGAPGLDSKILIRGITSFGDANPLIIVDGIEQNLNNINANEIESLQVLKDAGAASIYGVRGSNGVIIVTTKKGKISAPTVSYDGYYGMTYPLPGNPFNLLNSEDFMHVYNTAIPGNELFARGMPDYTYRGPNGAGVGFESDPEVNPANYFYEAPNRGRNYIIQKVNKKGEDWFHHFFKKAPRQNHTITVSGGTEKAKYLFSTGYMRQEGTATKTSLQRVSVRINTEYSIKNWLKIGENANFIYKSTPGFTNQDQFSTLTQIYRLFPITPLKDIKGNWAGSFGGPNLGSAGANPVGAQYRSIEKDVDRQFITLGNIFAEVNILKGLTARTSIGYNIQNLYSQDYGPNITENIEGSSNPDNLTISSNFATTMTFSNTLSYERIIGVHGIKALIGSEAIESVERGHFGSSADFFSNDFNYLILNNGTSGKTNSSWVNENSLFSLFARLDYSFDNKYLLGITIRRDGSSRFGSYKKYGTFPSLSMGWRISEEVFAKKLTWLDDLKIRGSYGILGSQNNISGNNAFSLYHSNLGRTYYDINGTGNSAELGFAQSQIGNANTGWEKDKVLNLGFDATILNQSLFISAEYYRKNTEGLLFNEPLPAVVAGSASTPVINIGDIRNTGFDISLTYKGTIAKDLSFSAGINFTPYKNTIVNIPDPGYFYAGGLLDTWDNICKNKEGHPMSSFYGYKVIGIFKSDDEVVSAATQDGAQPGRFRYQDTDKDGKITDKDRVFIGDPNPDFTFGIPLYFNYRNIDLSAFFYGSYGNDIFNSTRYFLDFFQYYPGNKSNRLLDAWTPENLNSTIPKIENTKSFSNCTVTNSYFIEDGSYLRLKSLILGYTFPSSLLQKFKMSKLRIYIESTNLFTITKYSGLDPELGGSNSNFGIDIGNYPNNECSIILGFNITF